MKKITQDKEKVVDYVEIKEEKRTHSALPEGTSLGCFQICCVLFENEESTVYTGKDLQGGDLWIQEFFPRSLAVRAEDTLDIVPCPDCQTKYQLALAAFQELFQTLKSAGNVDSVVPVEELLTIHNTAYAVKKAVNGITLQEYMDRRSQPLSWSETKKLMMPLLNGIAILHGKGLMHLGISPENVLVTEENKAWLRGFSTVEMRTADGELGFEKYDGFTSPEQYEEGSWKGGTWSDVYALGALLYWLLTGQRPQDGGLRRQEDELLPVMELNSAIPENVSDAISGAMMVDPDLRTATVDEFASALLESVSGNTAVYEVPDTMPNEHTVHLEKKKEPRFLHVLLTTLVSSAILGGLAFWAYSIVMDQQQKLQEQQQQQEEIQQKELYTVPDFVGHKAEDILNNADYAGQFTFQVKEEYNDQYPEGIIFHQNPVKGQSISPMGGVHLTVSKGSNSVEMPPLIGTSLETAKQILDESQIKYSIYVVENKNYSPNTVFRTDPQEGTKLSINDASFTAKIYVTPTAKAVSKPDKKDKDKNSSKSKKDNDDD